jgi:geranylgeranyl pyrophosphate synthase
LTLPVLRFWQCASAAEKARMQEMILNWKPEFLAPVIELLSQHETLGESLKVIQKYLQQARQALQGLPETANRTGLTGLTDYLARQTTTLGACA